MKKLYILPDNCFLSRLYNTGPDSEAGRFMAHSRQFAAICEPVALMALAGIQDAGAEKVDLLLDFYQGLFTSTGGYVANDVRDLEFLAALRKTPGLENFDGYRKRRAEKEILKKFAFAASRDLTILTWGSKTYAQIGAVVGLRCGVYDLSSAEWIIQCEDAGRRRLIEQWAAAAADLDDRNTAAHTTQHAASAARLHPNDGMAEMVGSQPLERHLKMNKPSFSRHLAGTCLVQPGPAASMVTGVSAVIGGGEI